MKALKAEAKRVKAAARKAKLDSIAMKRQAKATAQLEKLKAVELERAAKASARDSVRRAKVRAKALRRGRDVSHLDSLDAAARERDARIRDSIMNLGSKRGGDSVAGDERVIADASAVTDSTGMVQADTVHGDSLYRLVKAYRNVRVYRSDAQMVCDSMVSFSTDSIIHLYINPLLWNNSNQIASDVVVYIRPTARSRGRSFWGSRSWLPRSTPRITIRLRASR